MLNLFKLFLKPKSSKKYGSSKPVGKVSPATMQAVQAEWRSINTLLAGGQPSQLKQALIAADKTLDNVLRDMVAGETMAERLKAAKYSFDKSTGDIVWNAHRLRNTLVHESGIEVPHHVLRKSVEDLKKGLSALNVRL